MDWHTNDLIAVVAAQEAFEQIHTAIKNSECDCAQWAEESQKILATEILEALVPEHVFDCWQQKDAPIERLISS